MYASYSCRAFALLSTSYASATRRNFFSASGLPASSCLSGCHLSASLPHTRDSSGQQARMGARGRAYGCATPSPAAPGLRRAAHRAPSPHVRTCDRLF
jgi:hypothetical protein